MAEWRAIPGWEGEYEVSDDGQVRSLPRTILGRNGVMQPVRGGLLTLCDNGRGYWMVHLKRNRQRTPMTVHKAVLLAFVGPPRRGQLARHLDDNRRNNLLSNLCWGTHRENNHDAVRNGRNEKANRERCPRKHVLAQPNLTLESVRRGNRECLACKRAGANYAHARRTGRPFDLAAVADSHYREIMTGRAPTTTRRGPAVGRMKGFPRGTSIRGVVPSRPVAEPSRDSAAPGADAR